MGPDTRPGIVVSIATSGDLLQWQSHGHILVTDGAFSDDGPFRPLETWDGDAIMKLFRERLLARLIERHAISEELVRTSRREKEGSQLKVEAAPTKRRCSPSCLFGASWTIWT